MGQHQPEADPALTLVMMSENLARHLFLAYWVQEKIVDILQVKFSNLILCIEMDVFWFKFNWNMCSCV